MSTDPQPVSNQRVRIAGVIAMIIGVLVILFTRGVPGFEGVLWVIIALMLTVAGLVAIIKGGKKGSQDKR